MGRGQAREVSTKTVDELVRAVHTTLLAEGCREIRAGTDGRQLHFVTGTSAPSEELDGIATVAPRGSGSQLSITLLGREDSAGSLLDEWRTRRAAERLAGASAR